MRHCTQKRSKAEKVNLDEKWNIISSDEEIVSTFNDFVANAGANLIVPVVEHSLSNLQDTNPILTTVNSYDKYTSIEIMKYNMSFDVHFQKKQF